MGSGFFTTEPLGSPMCGRSGMLNAFQLTIFSMSDGFTGHNPHHTLGRSILSLCEILGVSIRHSLDQVCQSALFSGRCTLCGH